jgi:hypothetical protein
MFVVTRRKQEDQSVMQAAIFPKIMLQLISMSRDLSVTCCSERHQTSQYQYILIKLTYKADMMHIFFH